MVHAIPHTYPTSKGPSTSVIALAGVAIERGLKSLVALGGGRQGEQVKRQHSLLVLYDKLKPDVQNRIQASFEVSPSFGGGVLYQRTESIRDLVARHDRVYENARYSGPQGWRQQSSKGLNTLALITMASAINALVVDALSALVAIET